MTASTAAFIALVRDKKAVTALEYGLIARIIFGVILVGFTVLGSGPSSPVPSPR